MKKRILSIALVLCMALTLLPMSALAANYDGWAEATAQGVTLTVDTDTVTIGGVTYTYKGDASTSGIKMYTGDAMVSITALTEACCWKAESGYVLYNPTVESGKTTFAVVTLHNAVISTTDARALSLPYNSSFAESYAVPATVNVEGTNSLITTDASYYALYHQAGDTTFTGGGTLSLTNSAASAQYTLQNSKGAVTIEAGTQVVVNGGTGSQIAGNLTVTGSGSKLTIAGGTNLAIGVWGGTPAATVTVENEGVLENNGTLTMGERVDKDNSHIVGEISGSGGITLDDKTYTLVDGVFYPYGGDVETSGLNLSGKDASGNVDATHDAPAIQTCYKAGNGYILYTPTDGSTNANITLHGAQINTDTNTAISLPSDAQVDIVVVGDSSLTAGGSGNVIYTNGQSLSVTGSGDLTLAGPYYGISVNGTGAVSINIDGDLTFDTVYQPISTSADITVSANSITSNSGYYFQSGSGAVSLTATDGDIVFDDTEKTYKSNKISAYISIALNAPKGKINIAHSDSSYALMSSSGTVTVNAQNDVIINAASGNGIYASSGAVSVTSQSGNIKMECKSTQCVSAGGTVTLNAEIDVSLNVSETSSTAIRASGQAVDITAGGTLTSTSAYGFQVGALTIRANEVSIEGTQQDGIQASSVSIMNTDGGNCERVSVTATSSYDNCAAIHALGSATTGNITVKADDFFICGKGSAKAISALGTVTIGDAGLIVGAIAAGTDNIDSRILRAANGGNVSTSGLNISGKDASGNTDPTYNAPTVATYYTAGNGYILWNPTNKIITLHNASINTATGSALALPDNTVVVLEGDNLITSGDAASICGGDILTVQGSGTLEASGVDDGGLFAEQITVTGSADVTVNGIDNSNENEPSVTVSGNAVFTSTKSIRTGSYVQSGSASVTVNGQSLHGITTIDELRVEGGSLTVASEVAALMSAGVITLGSGMAILTPSGGKIASAELTVESVTRTITSVLPAGEAALTVELTGSTISSNGATSVAIGTAPVTPGSSGGGGSSSTTVTVPVTGGSGSVSFSASVSGNTATLTATDAQIKEIASAATTGTIQIDVSVLEVDAVVVPAKVVTAASDASGSTGLAVALPGGTVTFDKAALASVIGKGDLKISVDTVDNSKLTEAQKSALGNQSSTALVVDVNVFVNGTQASTFGDGRITVSVPYTPKSGENTDSITVWFIKDDGTIEPKNGMYNAATGCVEFITEHLSQYLIVSFPFADVTEDAWYYGSVAYAYNNGLFAGTGAVTFSPETSMTRQMIWMVLARLDGKTPADMDAARAWGIENGISDGSNPTSPITREQMATILYRYAQYKGYDVTQGGMAIREFVDYDSISEYALPALGWSVNAGLMQGSDKNLMPTGSATRAQVATILQRFCQNVAK